MSDSSPERLLANTHFFFHNTHNTIGDHMNDSIWANSVSLPSFPKLDKDLETDVLIIGGGIAGILCAWKLQQAGVDCTLVEADTVMHGVSRNTTAKLTAQHGFLYHKLLRRFGPTLAKQYYLSNEDALKQYEKLSKVIDCDFEIRDNFIYTLRDTEKLDCEWNALRQLDIPCSRHDELPLPFPVAGAIRFPDQAQFHPLKFAHPHLNPHYRKRLSLRYMPLYVFLCYWLVPDLQQETLPKHIFQRPLSL